MKTIKSILINLSISSAFVSLGSLFSPVVSSVGIVGGFNQSALSQVKILK